jgi:2-dehydro-3-deoxyphosphogluconate aldolase / (4S)-4-hydroxy-2-oxoglutarate aldolase
VKILDQLQKHPVLPILNLANRDSALRVTEALVKGGIKVFEITLRSPEALQALQSVREEFPDLTLGAGTIINKEQVTQAKDLGIDFGVSPGWSEELWAHSQKLDLPFFPGILTPTELSTAYRAGCRALKVFPIEPAGGISYLRSLIAPFRPMGIRYLPTGGIGRDKVSSYLLDEAVLTVGGSWLTPKDSIENKDFEKITGLAIEALSLGNRNP